MALHLINTGKPCRVSLMVPVERSVDVATGREIARREKRIEITVGPDEAHEIGPVRGPGWSEAMSAFTSDNAAAGIRFVYGPDWDGVFSLAMRVFSAGDPSDEPGIPRRYGLPVYDGGRRVRLPVLGRHGVIHRPGAPTHEDESDLFFYWRWADLPIEEIAFRADRRPDEIRHIIGAAVLRRAGALVRPRRAESLRVFDILDARRRWETIDMDVAVEQTGLSADALQRCLDVAKRLDLVSDQDRRTAAPEAPS